MVVSMMGHWSSPHTWPTALDQLCCFQLRINSFFHLFLFKLDPFRVPVLKASAINKKTFLKVVSLNLFLIILTLTQSFPFIFQSPVITFISFQLKFLHLFFSFLETSPCPLPSWHPLQCRGSFLSCSNNRLGGPEDWSSLTTSEVPLGSTLVPVCFVLEAQFKAGNHRVLCWQQQRAFVSSHNKARFSAIAQTGTTCSKSRACFGVYS